MPTLHLICGLPGSGKSTLAVRLEGEENAIRLTTDEWMSRLGAGANRQQRQRANEADADPRGHGVKPFVEGGVVVTGCGRTGVTGAADGAD